jgi:Ran GTPase-activating protein (RanGAP) involved in mRNA processing and transport
MYMLAAQLRNMANLRVLRLWHNQIGVAGAQALAAHLGAMTALQQLYLNGKDIGHAAGIDILEQMAHPGLKLTIYR